MKIEIAALLGSILLLFPSNQINKNRVEKETHFVINDVQDEKIWIFVLFLTFSMFADIVTVEVGFTLFVSSSEELGTPRYAQFFCV